SAKIEYACHQVLSLSSQPNARSASGVPPLRWDPSLALELGTPATTRTLSGNRRDPLFSGSMSATDPSENRARNRLALRDRQSGSAAGASGPQPGVHPLL